MDTVLAYRALDTVHAHAETGADDPAFRRYHDRGTSAQEGAAGVRVEGLAVGEKRAQPLVLRQRSRGGDEEAVGQGVLHVQDRGAIKVSAKVREFEARGRVLHETTSEENPWRAGSGPARM